MVGYILLLPMNILIPSDWIQNWWTSKELPFSRIFKIIKFDHYRLSCEVFCVTDLTHNYLFGCETSLLEDNIQSFINVSFNENLINTEPWN